MQMIEITEGFTSVGAGSESIATDYPGEPGIPVARRAPTGARVTAEFGRRSPLAPGELVRVRYDFAGDGGMREGVGIAIPTRPVVRCGRAVVFCYRVSYWIKASDIMRYAAVASSPVTLSDTAPSAGRFRS